MNKRLFIGNLSFGITEEQLREAFAAYNATGATIPTRWSRSFSKADKPKGYGFVELPANQVEAAIAGMQGHVLDGRAIDVSEAKPRPEPVRPEGRYGDRGGFGDRGGYRGGGGGGGRRW